MVTEGPGDWNRPHFFKPFLPHSYKQLAIPNAFRKHIDGEKCMDGRHVLLKNRHCRGSSWRVKLKDFCFQEGWSDFVRDHNLLLGDFVVFRHEGGLVFDVLVFCHSACEKKNYPALYVEKEEDKMEVEDDSRGKVCKEKEIKGSVGSIPLSRRAMTRNSNRRKALVSHSRIAKAQDPFEDSRRQFELKNPNMKYKTIPKNFVISNGLRRRIFEVIIRDPRGRLWPVRLLHGSSIRLGSGWLEFVSANHLKETDTCVFNLSNSGKIHNRGAIVLDFTISSSRNIRPCVESNSKIESTNPFFSKILRPFNFTSYQLNVPVNFARSNGLTGKTCKTTLKDGNGRSWSVKVKQRKSDHRVYISGDWAEISATNGFKEGDTCTVELTRKGKQKVMEFFLL